MANNLMAVFRWESGGTFKSDAPNQANSGGTGLIEFMPSTAKSFKCNFISCQCKTIRQKSKTMKRKSKTRWQKSETGSQESETILQESKTRS
ncbi:hypothetical protein [Chryseobacterium taichungense]|uniref:hypothetical protein n=1 Tax=Chryseobacterium taichungense TaxID=295069 RepID=UPI000B7FA51D|nr:hypothetical protein [Chryseobacterium taichungense]